MSSDEETCLELQDYVFEIGPPKILRHNTQIQNVSAEIDLSDFKLKKFFELDLKDLLEGNVECEFCNCQTLKWPAKQNDSEENVND